MKPIGCFVYFLVLSCSLVSAGNDPNCGTKGPHGDYFPSPGKLGVVNGADAKPNEYPWQGLFKYQGGTWCAGTILNADWVLCAAHCVVDVNGVAREAKDFVFVAGKHSRVDTDPTDIEVSIAELIVYPNFTHYTMDHDVVLFRLGESLNLDLPQVGSICLPDKQPLDQIAGRECTLVGWGSMDKIANGSPPKVLQKLTSFVWNQAECKNNPWRTVEITDRMVCWGSDRDGVSKNGCTGDSGGGIVCKLDDDKWYEYGVVSFVNGPDGLCTNTFLARTSELSEWIWDTIQNNS